MTRGIYLRANGEINCYCSTGEQISLARLPLDNTRFDFVQDYYLQGLFRKIRTSFANNELPFPSYCLKCNYLNPQARFDPGKVEQEIEWIHIEPVYGCNLRCTFCTHAQPEALKKRPSPHILPWTLYEKIVQDIARAGIKIKWMYCSGRGEPTLHPKIWDMPAEAKRLFSTNFLVNTNGQCTFQPEIITSGLDKIKLALDSLDQDTYARYRTGGQVTKIIALSKEISQAKERLNQTAPELIWQKVLFEFNDTAEELEAYQKAALRSRVNHLRFVLTWTKGYSSQHLDKIKKIFPSIEIVDAAKRSNVTLEEIRKLLSQDQTGDNCASLITACSKILHWFELGMQSREDYDLYAHLGFADPRLIRLRLGHPLLPQYLQSLQQGFNLLVGSYKAQGNTRAQAIYSNFSRQVAFLLERIN